MSKARELASLGNAYSDGALSNRNLIINGAMQVWQRGTSSTSTNTLVSVDRFYAVNTTKFDRSTDTPTGFQYSLLLGNSSAHFPYADQRIEAATMKQVEGKPLTISFWAKASSSVPSLFVEFVSPSVEDNYSTQTIRFNQAWASPSSSWTYYETTYASPHAEFLNGASIRIGLQNQGAGDLYITGVQLEVGDTATPFEHRSYGQELALCQRFFCTSGGTQVVPQFTGYEDDFFVEGVGAVYTNDLAYSNRINWPVPMRARPTVTIVSNSLCSAANQAVVYSRNGGWNTCDVTTPNAGTTGMMIDLRDNGGFVNRDSCMYFVGYYADAEL